MRKHAMRKLVVCGLTIAAVGLLIAVGQTAVKNEKSAKQTPVETPVSSAVGKFVVHEWGTFTSFSGSDSVKLEFRPLVDVDLPKFVLDRQQQSGEANPLSKVDTRALQRMETPVTYFYTDQPKQVKARVYFPQGLLTEFFPPVEKMEPKYHWFSSDNKIGDSSLDWGQFWIIPENQLQSAVTDNELKNNLNTRILKKLLPSAVVGDHYTFARETDSALVYIERPYNEKQPLTPYGGYFEKFLFYRGLGNFDLPLKLTAESNGRFELFNLGNAPIRQLFLVTVEDKQIKFSHYDQIGGGEKLLLTQSTEASTIEALSDAVVKALISEKLYEKEARSMVKTWSTSWFGEQGTRLFYMLPQRVTDSLLPLSIEPQPDEVVRVMVGRMEVMRPEDELRITKLVMQSYLDRSAAFKAQQQDANAKPYALPESVVKLGRLAEPALIRVRNLTRNESIISEANQLLSEYHAHRIALARAQAAKD